VPYCCIVYGVVAKIRLIRHVHGQLLHICGHFALQYVMCSRQHPACLMPIQISMLMLVHAHMSSRILSTPSLLQVLL